MREHVFAELKATFRPEFLNRLDEVVLFKALGKEDILGIVDIQVALLARRLSERGLALEVDASARKHLADAGYDPVYGARPLKRAIQRHLENPLSKEILAGLFASGDTVVASAGKSGLVFEKAASVVK